MRGIRGNFGKWLGGALVSMLAVAAAQRGEAADITVLMVPPVQRVVPSLAGAFQRETGHDVSMSFTAVRYMREVIAGDAVDVVILADNALDEMVKDGVVLPGTRTDIARVGLGVIVRQGTPLPNISTPLALRQALVSARSITYVNPAIGIGGAHFEGVLQRLGIAEAVKPKTLLVTGGSAAAEAVARGDAALGVQATSDARDVKGVAFVGPLPAELQKVFTFSAGVTARSHSPDAARSFIAFLARPSSKAKFAEAGLN